MPFTPSQTAYLYHHVVLPPKLPQENDMDAAQDRSLLELVFQALEYLLDHVDELHVNTVISAIGAVKNLLDSRDIHGNISEVQVEALLHHLTNNMTHSALPLEIKAQNAGILISRSLAHLDFDFFELSPTNKAAMGSTRLKRVFPASASRIPINRMADKGLRKTIAGTLAKLSTQTAPGFQPQIRKNGKREDENRDTIAPDLVTDYFLNVVTGLGETSNVECITKCTREDVLWRDCLLPWRRSPLWLLVRVSLQLTVTRKAARSSSPRALYKAFMLFVLARLLNLVQENSESKDVGGEAVHITSAKLQRRLRKFERDGQSDCLRGDWTKSIHRDIVNAHMCVQKYWQNVPSSMSAKANTMAMLSRPSENELDLSVPVLDEFLTAVHARDHDMPLSQFRPSSEFPKFSKKQLPGSLNGPSDYTHFRLAALERWVEQHLRSWMTSYRSRETTCGHLYDLMEYYYDNAIVAYEDSPVSLSVMYLTLAELWIACDESACFIFPHLRDYDPEICLAEFQCLVLPLMEHMQRLHEVEEYIQSRRDNAISGLPSLYRSFGHRSSFAVVHFNQCESLKATLRRIEVQASGMKKRKCEELKSLKSKQEELMRQHNNSVCDSEQGLSNLQHGYTTSPHPTSRHPTSCRRCAYKSQAEGLSINIFEWPLSSDPAIARATVFELCIPEAFSGWRNASVFMINTIFGHWDTKAKEPLFSYTLDKQRDISRLLTARYDRQRIVPLSEVKPYSVTHRRVKKITPTLAEDDICLGNALRYEYYDTKLGVLCDAAPSCTEEIAKKCMYRMPQRSQAMEDFIYRPPKSPEGYYPNEVIASLCDCPPHMSTEEYKALNVIPLGTHLLYRNILAQLASSAVDFAKVETQCLIFQTIHQVGISSQNIERVNHLVLSEEAFGRTMLDQLGIALERVKENWVSWRAAACFSHIARRISSLTRSSQIRTRTLDFLDRLRKICSRWLHALKERALSSTTDEQKWEMYSRATEIALLCTTTYDVESADFWTTLKKKSAVKRLIKCSIIIQENGNSVRSDDRGLYHAMLQSYRALMYRIFSTLHEFILEKDSTGLFKAVKANWVAFDLNKTEEWRSMNPPRQHWLYTTSGARSVDYNLLTGELLIEGIPLSRLPLDYRLHESYRQLFSDAILEVYPTDEPGLRYSAQDSYHGCNLHFGMHGHDMLVLAVGSDTRVDLVPSRVFKNQLPEAFVSQYIHWYDHASGEVIFRSHESPWSTETNVWRLKRHGSTSKWRLVKGPKVLVSFVSTTASILAKVVLSLENAQHVHVVLDASTQVVDVEIPRLHLAFFLKQGDDSLHSCQFRGMIIDENQNIGSLIGLESKLVLKRGQSERMMLVPVPERFGRTSILYTRQPITNHVTVSINKDEVAKVYAYMIDENLGRIVDSGNLQSKLLIAYLHALTSSCLPDPLIKMTGTEASLQILQSAAVRSFDLLTKQNVGLLGQIASLSVKRVFYPCYLKEMQTVKWDNDLPTLSQHSYFRRCVNEIFDHAANMQLFFPDSDVFGLITDARNRSDTNAHLDERDQIRTSLFRVPGFGAEPGIPLQDEMYEARDRHERSERGWRAFLAVTLTQRNGAALSMPVLGFKDLLLNTHFSRASVKGLDDSFDYSDLNYDSKWLEDVSPHLKESWCTWHQVLAAPSASCNRFDIMAWLSTMAYAVSADMNIIQALIAIYKIPEFGLVNMPQANLFTPAAGAIFRIHEVEAIVRTNTTPFESSEECHLPKQGNETNQQHTRRIRSEFQTRRDLAIKKFVTDLKNQWPVRIPSLPHCGGFDLYLRASDAMASIIEKFKIWHDNMEFSRYLWNLSRLLASQAISPVTNPFHFYTSSNENQALCPKRGQISLDDIFAAMPNFSTRHSSDQSTPDQLTAPIEPRIPTGEIALASEVPDTRIKLEELCQRLQASAVANTELDYITQLRLSCAALDEHTGSDLVQGKVPAGTREILQKYLVDCKKYFKDLNDALLRSVMDRDSFSIRISLNTDQSVRLNPRFWLSQLHRDRFHLMSEGWKAALIKYGLALTNLHRATRLVSLSDESVDLYEELRHVGHSNWDPMQFPETLLLEAESGIMVRKEQEVIASHMRTPANGDNIVLQLLMGGGKSSVIVPILAANLTDKEKLVRVVIAKAQSQQMLQMLIAKLGGILDRRVYHMPFSRNLKLSLAGAESIQRLYGECVKNRGVLLIQPEHILSFKLMAIESLLTDQVRLARSMLSTEAYFNNVTRDIVDESDEIYSTKFELVYTMGLQESIEFAPERWLIIQQLLALLPRFALEVHKRMPGAIDIQNIDDGRYPRIRFLNTEAADQVLYSLANHIVDWGLSGLATRSQSKDLRAAILRYITEIELKPVDLHQVELSKFWTSSTKLTLLLVRGLIAGGVLRFAFSNKRWRVNFGLDETRIPHTSLAVPFRSKDTPSPRSEFSHPDVVIILTLLSQYYGGLTNEQLSHTLTHVLNSDQAEIYYEDFVRTATSRLPAAYRHLAGVNISDRQNCVNEVFPALRYSKNAIDYYHSNLVFPKECRQFPQKLSTSGWDLGGIKTFPTTGFSGTNDTLHLLPLDVKHLDLSTQRHTNAQVLAYLLQDDTHVELLPLLTGESCSDGEHLLTAIQTLQSDIRMILDCGASILELNNREVAQRWLQMQGENIEAVVYFEGEELSVLDRMDRTESFQTSPYAKQIESCIVYLDEAHTRGTDLRLPRDYRAAVTLGAQLTKDRLTQACMRLRKLGNGQSVTFIVPEEIATKIRGLAYKRVEEAITSTDVLCWAISETEQDLKRSIPLWAMQGLRFESHRHVLIGNGTTKEQAEVFLEDEAQSIEARYSPRQNNDSSSHPANWDISNQNIAQIISRCRDFEALSFGSVVLSEEQERELAPEIEEQRHVERIPRMRAEKHVLHPDMILLVQEGMVVVDSEAYEPAFEALRSTRAGKLFDFDQDPSFPTDLLVTADYLHTVSPISGSASTSFISDSFLRPVQFVLSVPTSYKSDTISHLIIISPFEADYLLPKICQTKQVTLHLFTARSNAKFSSLDQLMLHNVGRAFSPTSVSRSLIIQLNLFSGSLYLRSLSEYNELCDYLGLIRTSEPEMGQEVSVDGFITPPAGKWGLKQSPVPFLRALITKIRHEGTGVEKTHLGKLLNGVQLERQDFE